MRKCFLLKLSLRILDQLKVLIFVLPCKDGHSSYSRMGQVRNAESRWASLSLRGATPAWLLPPPRPGDGGRGFWWLTFSWSPKVGIEFRGFTLPSEAVCANPGCQDKPPRGQGRGWHLSRLQRYPGYCRNSRPTGNSRLPFAGKRSRAQLTPRPSAGCRGTALLLTIAPQLGRSRAALGSRRAQGKASYSVRWHREPRLSGSAQLPLGSQTL